MAFKLPESLEGLTVDELTALVDEARTELADLNITEDSSDDDIAAAEVLVDAKAALVAQKETAVAAAAERAEKVARLAEAAQPDPEPEAPEAEAEGEAAPEAAETPEPVPASAEVITPDEVTNPADEPEKVAVAASSQSVQRAAANALPVDFAPPKPGISLTAAAGVPGLRDGQKLEGLDDVVDVLVNRIKGMPKQNLATGSTAVHQRFGAVQIHRDPADDALVQGNTGNDWDLVERAGNETRLPGGSLVAAAINNDVSGPAWCSPSETLYDLCEVEDVTGMWDVPEFTVSRGGIRYTKGPKWDDVYGNGNRGFELRNNGTSTGGAGSPTQGQAADTLMLHDADGVAIADDANLTPARPQKPCIMVDCYPWEEVRLSCDGLCIKSPLLLEVTYPELIKRFTEMVLVAHRHDANRRNLAELEAAATADIGGAVPMAQEQAPSRTAFNLRGLEIQAMALRAKYRKPINSTVEVVLDWYVKEFIKWDIGMENGRDSRCVSDAEVDAWFTCRNLRVQWVYDWHDIVVGDDLEITWPNPGGTAGTEPLTTRAVMYPAGSWTKGTADVISLDTVYDSQSLADNVFTALFMEECDLLVQRCTESAVIDIPICATGAGIEDVLAACATNAYA